MSIPFIVLILWIPVCTSLFALFRPLRALTLAYLIGWLALPMAKISIQGFWDIDKILATNAGAIFGAILFCPGQFRGYKIRFPDVALLVFASGTCITSIVNGLGAYDGASAMTHKLLYYAVPFWLGRAFVKDRRDLLEASRLIVCGAALYAILAVWEWRMSPQIHRMLYGYFQKSWQLHFRWGFWRPIVCSPSALGLGTFFAWTALLGVWLYRIGKVPRTMGLRPLIVVALPLLGLLVSMSLGPWTLFLMGLGLLTIWRRMSWRWVLWTPVAFALFWTAGRYTGMTDGQWLTTAAARVSEERAASLQYRIDAERVLIERARRRAVFGWGTWGRNRPSYEGGPGVAIDGLWIILLGSYGLVGLVTFYVWWCWPLVICASSEYKGQWRTPVGVLLVASGIQAVNFSFNAFLSPILILMCGGLVTSLASSEREGCERRMELSRIRSRFVQTPSGFGQSSVVGVHVVAIPRK